MNGTDDADGGPGWWPATPRAAALGVFALVCVTVVVDNLLKLRSYGWTLFDTRIYLDATRQTLDGTADLYAATFGDGWPFTYPPFAVLAFAPLTVVPAAVATALLTLVGALCLCRICWLCAEHFPLGHLLPAATPAAAQEARGDRGGRHLLTPLLATVMLLLTSQSDPVEGTFAFGQINLIIAWLVVEDYLTLGRRQGMLIGLAAGIKVTPALAAVPRLLTRQWRQAAWTIATGLATVAVSAILLPQEVVTYFFDALWDTSRPGSASNEWNQSLAGAVARTMPDSSVAGGVRLVLVAVAVTTGLYAAARLLRRGDPLGAVLVTFVCTAAVSPISWYHHLVMLPIFCLWAMTTPTRWSSRAWALAIAAQALALAVWLQAGLYQFVPRDNGAELRHSAPETLISEAVPVSCLTILASLAWSLRTPPRLEPTAAPGDGAGTPATGR